MSKLIRVDDNTHQGLVELSQILGVTIGQAVRWLANDGLPRARNPQPGDVLGNLAKLNRPFDPMPMNGEDRMAGAF